MTAINELPETPASRLGRELHLTDPAQLADVYISWGALGMSTARRLTGDSGLAEDAFQTAVFDLWKGRDAIRPETARDLFLTIVGRKAIDIVRRQKKEQGTVLLDMSEAYSVSPLYADSSEDFAAAERHLLLEETLAGLPPETREIMELTAQGFTQNEIASMMDMPLGTIKTRTARCKAKLQKELAVPQTAPAVGDNDEIEGSVAIAQSATPITDRETISAMSRRMNYSRSSALAIAAQTLIKRIYQGSEQAMPTISSDMVERLFEHPFFSKPSTTRQRTMRRTIISGLLAGLNDEQIAEQAGATQVTVRKTISRLQQILQPSIVTTNA